MYILGIKCSGHDTGAALISDRSGKVEISAISEARLNRRKHSYTYPLLSIRYVMERFGLTSLDEIDLICVDKHGELWPEESSQFGRLAATRNPAHPYDFDARFNYLVEQSIRFPRDKVVYVNHIDAHAASSYYVSGFEKAAVLVIEGGTGLYLGDDRVLKTIDRTGYGGDEYQDGTISHRADLSWPRHRQNISNLYDLITRKLGLDKFAAGKTMALAAFRDRFPVRNYLNIPSDRHDGLMADYSQLLLRLGREVRDFVPTSKATRDAELVSEYWVNIAREVQDALEEDVLYMAGLAARKSGARNLCLAGGVALSCVTNRKILDLGLFDNVFVQPAASDEGIPLGCALWGYYMRGNGTCRASMPNAYLGTPNEPARVPQLLESWGLPATKATAGDAARLLAEGNIIGRIAAGAEYGPRALGNRSILADPRIANMLEIVNTQIKHRERYRPFAPSCHADKQDRYFDLPCPSPFMLMACAVLPGAAEQIPAVIHVDGTSRVQSVMPLQNERYYELIDKFGEITGVYTLLNTSFNDDGEPIVETYEDALLSFVRTGLHYLYAEDYLIKRPEQAVCARIRNELASQIREGVARRYAEEIALFCDGERYSSLERSVKGRTVAYGVLIMSEFMRRARAQKFEERNDTSSYGNWIRVALNRFGSVARHSRSKIARSAALVPMIITRFFIVARESLETPRH